MPWLPLRYPLVFLARRVYTGITSIPWLSPGGCTHFQRRHGCAAREVMGSKNAAERTSGGAAMETRERLHVFCQRKVIPAVFRMLMPVFLGVFLMATACSKLSQQSSTQKGQSSETAPKAAATREVAAQPAAPSEAARQSALDWAMKQDQIKNDPNGQWAVTATASSSYNDAKGTDGWSPNQTAGPPDVQTYSDDGKAWAPKEQDAGIEWLELAYVKPVHATEVRVRESFGSGAVIKIELQDEQGARHTVWTGTDPTKGLDYLVATFPKTPYKAAKVKVTLATNLVPGWNEIDAVQLVGTEQ
jgi:hypothetical protein